MDAVVVEKVTTLLKALEAGYALGPAGTSVQGAALQRQDLQGIMNNVTYQSSMLILQRVVPARAAKSMTVEYRRQLSYGGLQGVATTEVSAGRSLTGDYESLVAAMAFYTVSSVVSYAATVVETFDNVQNESREAHNAAMVIAGAIELDLFRGHADFSNGGVFDGSPGQMPIIMPGMIGLDPQIRQADINLAARSLDMFEYGANGLTVISVGGTLAQSNVEDALARARMNFGEATTLYLDPLTHAAYNKIIFAKEHSYVNMGQNPPSGTGAVLTTQYTANGQCSLVASRFLSGKVAPPPVLVQGTPAAPTVTAAILTSSTAFTANEVVTYFVTASNEVGEGPASSNVTITFNYNGEGTTLSITAVSNSTSGPYWYNVYSSLPGTAATTNTMNINFIGRVKATTAPLSIVTTFTDLGNKLPGSVTGFLLDKRNIERPQLSPFASLVGATVDTAIRKLFVQVECIVDITPTFSCLLDNLTK